MPQECDVDRQLQSIRGLVYQPRLSTYRGQICQQGDEQQGQSVQEADHAEHQETPELSSGNNVWLEGHIFPDQVVRRWRKLDRRAAQLFQTAPVRSSDPMRLGNGLEGDEPIVFAVRLGLLLLLSRLTVFPDEGINVGAFLVDLITKVFHLLAVVFDGVLRLALAVAYVNGKNGVPWFPRRTQGIRLW